MIEEHTIHLNTAGVVWILISTATDLTGQPIGFEFLLQFHAPSPCFF